MALSLYKEAFRKVRDIFLVSALDESMPGLSAPRCQYAVKLVRNDTSLQSVSPSKSTILVLASKYYSWLARRFVHFDANFRLVLAKQAKRDAGDRRLWDGPGFFVQSDIYEKYLSIADQSQQEVSRFSD